MLMSTQRSTRSASQSISSNKVKSFEKHIVFALDDAEGMKRQAQAWVDLKNQYYQKQLGKNFKPYEDGLLPYRLCVASLHDR